jgi:VWFA-related protein
MRHGARPALLASLLVAGVVRVLAQDVSPGAQAELVRLDVVVADAHGRPVRDLAREDFEVLEDGKAQRVTSFLFVGRARPRPASLTKPDASGEPPAEGASRPSRCVVIVVDDLHVARQDLDSAKEALRGLVDQLVGADDGVALVTTGGPGGVPQLTPDRAVLRAAINELSSREAVTAPASGSQMTPVQAEMILRGDRSALRLAARTLMDQAGALFDASGPRASAEAAAGFAPGDVDPQERAAALEVQRQARGVLGETLRLSAVTLGRIEGVLRTLAPLPGRKLCLLVSGGFLVGTGTSEEQSQELRQVISAATRSRVVLYTLDSHGPASNGADAGVVGAGAPPGLQERVAGQAEKEFRAVLERLASDTGGFLVRGSDLAGGLRRMLEDNDAYYLMAYEPSNLKHDGRYRKIDVRLRGHPDFAVRARKGYLALDERSRPSGSDRPGGSAPPASAPARLDEAESRAALRAPLPPNGVPVRLTADYLDLPPAGPQAIVLAQVDVAGLRWQAVQGRHRADAELVGGVYDATGSPVGLPFGRRFDLDLAPDEYERALQAGLQYQQRLPLEPGRYEVRLIVRDPALGPLGGAAQAIEIPNLGNGTLTLSGVFLSTSALAAEVPASDGAGRSETLRDAQVRRRFKSGEGVYFQLYVYNVRVDEKKASDAVLQAQVRSGAKLVAASKPLPVTFQQKDGVPLLQSNRMSLEGLAPGRYELRVVVVDRKANATAFRDIDFTVE